ncbi:hypothetical protein HDU81_003716 [Chytriomyces hyalinus]|nr:hypothetical protein HDU81_003716 [Chytriomyces hyalinus]
MAIETYFRTREQTPDSPRLSPSTPEPSSASASAQAAKVVVSPALATIASKCRNSSQLYDGLNSEEKARLAIVKAVAANPQQLLAEYSLRRVLGFGSNGVVIAAIHIKSRSSVAIKLIYKESASKSLASVPAEVNILRLFAKSSSNLLRHIADFQDSNHFIVITELFGNDWLAAESLADSPASGNLKPLVFKSHFKEEALHELDFSAGSSDLWAWAYSHRAHVMKTEGHSLLPLLPVKQIIKQLASALYTMHSAGFYHGDVKIENVLINSTPTGPGVRLADFGHAKHASLGIKSYGTIEVSAPEFLRDSPFVAPELDGRAADVFALGMLLYTLLDEHGALPESVEAAKIGKLSYHSLIMRNGGQYPMSGLCDLDNDGWNLIQGMCLVDPNQRVTIDEVLAHPWLIVD